MFLVWVTIPEVVCVIWGGTAPLLHRAWWNHFWSVVCICAENRRLAESPNTGDYKDNFFNFSPTVRNTARALLHLNCTCLSLPKQPLWCGIVCTSAGDYSCSSFLIPSVPCSLFLEPQEWIYWIIAHGTAVELSALLTWRKILETVVTGFETFFSPLYT